MAEQLPHLEGLDQEEYRRVVEGLSHLDPIPIAALVTRPYIFDFLILFESLHESWRFYPFELHAFVLERDVQDTLSSTGIDSIHVHRLSKKAGNWVDNAARKVQLVEESGLSRCVVSDADNVFLAEIPELYVLLDKHDFVFVAAPHQGWVIQTNLWSFRRNERSIAFARDWYSHSAARDAADASGLPFALTENRETGVRIKVLARSKPDESTYWQRSPYDVQANLTPFELRKDELGFKEAEMGRARVIHLSGVAGQGRNSLQDRVDFVVNNFPQCASFLPLYVRFATRAARRLGIQAPPNPSAYLHDRMLDAGLLANRWELPALLNRRGLAGAGMHVGVDGDGFSAHIVKHWRGYLLSTESVPAEEDSFDFVYLDTRRSRDSLKQQLEHWYPKVRRGGILAGCDVDNGGERPRSQLEAHTFFEERGLRIKTTYADDECPCWLVEIPKSEAERVDRQVEVLAIRIRREIEKPRHDRDRKSLKLWREQLEALTGKSVGEVLRPPGRRVVR